MPAPVSRKQARYMYAILNSKKSGTSSRGDRVPKSVAGKYVSNMKSKKNPTSTDGLPESKGKEMEGGKWGEKHHAKAHVKVKEERQKRKDDKQARKAKAMKKSDSWNEAVGAIILNERGEILIGRDSDNRWSLPGGKLQIGEEWIDGVKREVKEETGLDIDNLSTVAHVDGSDFDNKDVRVYEATVIGQQPKDSDELSNLTWHDFHNDHINVDDIRPCCANALQVYFQGRVQKSKSLKDMVVLEELKKNIIRSQVGSDVVHDMTHGDALRLVGKGTFRFLRDVTRDMGDEDFKDVTFDTYKISIRKHANDVYSGRVTDGYKLVHQWTNRSLPTMAAELMSVFEWYSPEDEPHLEHFRDEDTVDEDIDGGMHQLLDNYKRHNIGAIYEEMENIRQDIRNGAAVDLQQVEQRIMKLFDRLEESLMESVDKHNQLCNDVGEEVDEIHSKLLELQNKLDELGRQPTKVEAYSPAPANPNAVYHESYMYLPKPSVVIMPDGRITISFGADWTHLDRDNFLQDLKAKAIKGRK